MAATRSVVTGSTSLTKEEETFLRALKLDDPKHCSPELLQLFFAVLHHSERSKRSEILEKFLIFPWIKPGAKFDHVPRQLLTIEGWQELIYLLFEGAADDNSNNGCKELEPAAEQKLFGLAMFILANVHWFELQHAPALSAPDYTVAELLTQSLDLLEEFAGWSEDVVMLARLFLNSLIQLLISNAQRLLEEPGSIIWDRIFQVFDVVEAFIFYRPTQNNQANYLLNAANFANKLILALHIDEQHGLCQDLLLVEKLLEFFDKALKIDKLEENNPQKDKSAAKAQQNNIKRGKLYRDYFNQIAIFMKNIETQRLDAKLEEKFIDSFVETCLTREVHQETQLNKSKFKEKLLQMKEFINDIKKPQNFGGAAKLASNLLHKKASTDNKIAQNNQNKAPVAPKPADVAPKQGLGAIAESKLGQKKQGTLEARLDNYQTIVPQIQSIRSGARKSLRMNSPLQATLKPPPAAAAAAAAATATAAEINPVKAGTIGQQTLRLGGLASSRYGTNNKGNNTMNMLQLECGRLESAMFCPHCLASTGSLTATKNRKDVLFEPCMHVAVCTQHAANLINCSLCNVKLTAKRQVKWG
jgi:hypothetical protein